MVDSDGFHSLSRSLLRALTLPLFLLLSLSLSLSPRVVDLEEASRARSEVAGAHLD